MGGTSTASQQTTSNSAPWAPAMPEVQGLLSGVQGQLGNTGLTGTQGQAINQLTQMGQAGNPYAGGTAGAVNNLLGGGGALSQAPTVQAAYSQYGANTSPLANNTNYNPMNTPGLSDALSALNSDITGQVNGQFAAGGRTGSGMNTQTLARGLSQGEGQLLTNQYNQNVQNQQAAAGNLFNAGNTTANTIGGMGQNAAQNQNAGLGNVAGALTNSQWGPQQVLAAQELAKSIPASNLGMLAQIGIPLAQLGQTSNGTSNTQSTASPLTQLQQASSIFGSGPSTAANGATSGGSGLMGLLGML